MAIIKTPHVYNNTTARWEPGPVTTVTHIGRVVARFNRDYRAMSDVYTYATYAVVLMDDGSYPEIMVNSNFELDVGGGSCEVDAPAEVLARYEAHLAAVEAARIETARAAAEAREAARLFKGRKVRVVKGRRVPVGFEGEIMWIGEGSYGTRVGIRDVAGKVEFTAASNVAVVTA